MTERRVRTARARAATLDMLRGRVGQHAPAYIAALVSTPYRIARADESIPPRIVRVEWSDGAREDVRV